MSEDKTEIRNSFLPSLTKFEVTGLILHKKHIEGTAGYLCYTHKYKNRSDILSHRVKLIRRGKSGQPRIEDTNILCPSYYEDVRKGTLEEALGNYESSGLLEVKSIDMILKDVFKMEPLDFIGWAAAYASLLHHIRHTYITMEKSWPKSNKHILNLFHFIHRNFNAIIKDPNSFYTNYAGVPMRLDFVNAARKKELEFMRGVTQYRNHTINLRNHACYQILGKLNSRSIMFTRLSQERAKVMKAINAGDNHV